MNFKIVSKTLGRYLIYFSLVLLVPLFVDLYYQFISKSTNFPPVFSSLEFFETFLICNALGLLLYFIGKKSKAPLMKKDSILLVVLIWVLSAFISALPFTLTGTLENPYDAYFEAMSGLTTTGSTIMHPKAYNSEGKEVPISVTDIHLPEKTYSFYGTIKPVVDPSTNIKYVGIEAVGKSLLFWRSFIQWLGGMGIVVLFLAVLPTLTAGGRYLYQLEVPGPTKEALSPRIKETASILWKIYLGLTIVEIYLLIWTNRQMPLFDAFCIAFSTISTGGFTVKNASIGAYNNACTEWIVIIFMIVGSMNFGIFFQLIRRKFYSLFDPDFLFFFAVTLIGTFLVISSIIGQKQYPLSGPEDIYTLSSAIRSGTFQAVSAQTSTGFATDNFDMWPFAPQVILIILMFIGGMTGSTAGGIKTSRIYILIKIILHKVRSIFHPESISKLLIGKQEIDSKISTTVLVFFAIVMISAVGSTLIYTYHGIDPDTAISVVACSLNNVGLALRAAGPTESFAFLSDFGKFLSSFLMLLGRLEYFTLILLFFPSFWKKA